jgi:hypothetical protein
MTPQDHGWSSLLVAVALVGAYFTIDGAQPYAVALLVALVPVDVYVRFVRSVPTVHRPKRYVAPHAGRPPETPA